MSQARRGDLAAFDRLMERHQRQVLRTAERLLRRPEDAEDAAQEVFLRLYRYLGRIQEAAPLEPWLYRVTVNVCRDLGRARQRRAAAPLDAVAEPTSHEAGPEAQLGWSQEQRQTVALLGRLPLKEREALVLRDVEGLATDEVARLLGTTPTTVRSQISRARLKLVRWRSEASFGGSS